MTIQLAANAHDAEIKKLIVNLLMRSSRKSTRYAIAPKGRNYYLTSPRIPPSKKDKSRALKEAM